MIPNLIKIGKQILGSSLLLPAYGRVGQGQHSLATHFAKRNTKNCGGENEGGQKLFCDFKNPFKIVAEAKPRRRRGEATIAQNPNSENWRRERDSNPR